MYQLCVIVNINIIFFSVHANTEILEILACSAKQDISLLMAINCNSSFAWCHIHQKHSCGEFKKSQVSRVQILALPELEQHIEPS